MSILKLGQKKTYRIQKDAMAEFGYDLKFAMRGGYRLSDRDMVWFPNLSDSENDEFDAPVGNVMKNEGRVLIELFSTERAYDRSLKYMTLKRITFARKRGENYWFSGMYIYDGADKSTLRIKYRRVDTEVDTDNHKCARIN